MRGKNTQRNCIIAIGVTENEKIAIAEAAELEKRSVSNYIRYRLNDILEGVNDDDRT
jgi:hypothetical protein